MPGTTTSQAEVTNISKHGFWMLIDDEELFLSFENFPWFQGATIEEICDFQRPHHDHFCWALLDIDLSIDSIRSPDQYPLIAATKTN